MQPWTDPAWVAEADAWIGERLAELGMHRTGAVEQPHVRAWSTAMRIPTSAGDLWFKANLPVLAYEAHVVEALDRVRPDHVPELVAVEHDRGWMLMRDGGERLREVVARERRLERWLGVLPLYAGLQLAAAPLADELVAAGTPDLRLARLAGLYARLVEELDGLEPDERARLLESVPDVEELCSAVASHGIPETIQHNDLHDGQVFVSGGRYRILDWGDACVSHPFTTMSVTLEGVLAFGLDDVEGSVDTTPYRNAYVDPFSHHGRDEALDAAMAGALRLGWICRAVVTHPLALAVAGDERERLLANVRAYLGLAARRH